MFEIRDVFDDNIDVFVELEYGIWYMNKENINFMPAAPPSIIVRSLAEENIRNAVENYAEENALWLKSIYLAGGDGSNFDIHQINQKLKEIQDHKDE